MFFGAAASVALGPAGKDLVDCPGQGVRGDESSALSANGRA